jgi:serine/threonine protein kinase/tetratricopeptide (TPR) repeat protein
VPDRPDAKDYAIAALTPPSASVPPRLFGAPDTGQSAHQFVAGTLFAGRYRMVAPLGPGEVWRADDLVLQTPVALKLLRPTAARAGERILAEARLARQITHPAVCRVFDVGEADGCVFYSMELVEGEDLATLLRRAGTLSVEKVADIAAQLCEALVAAHSQRIVHGNLKPTNVLLDQDGLVRVADFGFAIDEHDDTADSPYRAPELRSPGRQPTERSDLFSVGAILFQLLTGTAPDPSTMSGASRTRKLMRLAPGIDPHFARGVVAALARDPDQRPVSATVLAERLRGVETARRRDWVWIAAAFAILVVLAAVAVRMFSPPAALPLSDRDTMVVADFTNSTGETVFDGALKVALAVALEQSPFLRVLPDERIRETLRLMERSPDERITRTVAREIAAREQARALVAGSIGTLGSHYVLALEAVSAQTGEVIAREQVEVASREDVLGALGTAAATLRNRLGESRTSVQRFDVPLARATTASLEALHAYSLALDDGQLNLREEAIPHLERALELDPQFALAQAMLAAIYANTYRTAEAPAYARRAFELRDRVSERERFLISWRYYKDSAQAWDDAIALATVWTKTYPREALAFNSLGMASAAFGRHEPAVNAFRAALRIDARFLPPHGNLAGSLIALGRYDEAQTVVREARALGVDAASLHRAAYVTAAVHDDAAGMADALAAARKTADAAIVSFNWEAHEAAFRGRMQAAHSLFERAVDQATQARQMELAAQWRAEDGESHALAGDCPTARAEIDSALDLSRDNFTLERSARTLALCGAGEESRALDAELARRYPDATLTQQIQRPVIAALLALQAQPARAIDLLEAARPYDSAPSAEFWPNYVRGLAYLRLNDASKATAEFQRITSHRSEAPTSMLYGLATLGRARATAMTRDRDGARRDYAEFLTLWRDADTGIRPLEAARRESASLR